MVKIKVPSLDEIKRREIKEMKRQIKEKLKEVEWDIKAGDYKEALDKLGEIKKEVKKFYLYPL